MTSGLAASHRRRSKPTRAAVGVVLLTVALVACRPAPTTNGSRVLVIGDSITYLVSSTVQSALEHDGWQPVIKALGGSRIEDWSPFIPSLVKQSHANVVVIELGTNCCLSWATLPSVIDGVMHDLQDVDAVLWLNVQTQPPYPPDDPRAINLALARAHVHWSNMVLVDFSSHFADHPEWHISPDFTGVHLNAAGGVELGRFLVSQLRAVKASH